ncbi:MAG: hypothetical protein Hals2KO_19760 [Halioglobus sp.]
MRVANIMLRLMLTLLLFGLLGVLGALSFLHLGDLNRYTEHIEALVESATGRGLTIGGPVDVDLWPVLTLRAENLSLANAHWGSAESMARVGSVQLLVAPLSLLLGPIDIRDLKLQDTLILLEEGPDGQSNWALGTPTEEASKTDQGWSASELPVVLQRAEISSFVVQQASGKTQNELLSLKALQVETQDSASIITASGMLAELPLALRISGKREEAARATASLNGSLGELNLESSVEHADHELTASARLTGLRKFALQLDLPEVPDSELNANATATTQKGLSLSSLSLTAANTRVEVTGPVVAGETQHSLQLSATGDDLSQWSEALPALTFSLQGKLLLQPGQLQVDAFHVQVDNSDLLINATLESGEPAAVRGSVSSKQFDLTRFKRAAPENATQPGQYVFTTEPLPLEPLAGQRVALQLKVQTLITDINDIHDLDLSLNLNDGQLDARLDFLGEHGGQMSARTLLEVTDTIESLQLAVNARNLRINLASGDDASAGDIPPVSASVNLRSKGGSARELAATSSGRVLLTMNEGLLNNELVGRFSGDIVTQLFSMLNPFANQQTLSRFECALLAFEITDGTGKMDPIVYQDSKVLVVASGELDLNTEAVNLVFKTQPREGVGVTADMFVTPFVAVGGTMANPSLSLNKKGVLLQGGLAAVTGGLSLFAQAALDRFEGQRDYCDTLQQQPAFMHPPLQAAANMLGAAE